MVPGLNRFLAATVALGQTAMITFFFFFYSSAFQHLLLERLCNSLCHSLSGYIIQTQLRHQQGNDFILCQLEQQRTESARRRAFTKLRGGREGGANFALQTETQHTHTHAHQKKKKKKMCSHLHLKQNILLCGRSGHCGATEGEKTRINSSSSLMLRATSEKQEGRL